MNVMNEATIDHHRLYELSDRINRKVAPKAEKDELVYRIYNLGKINDKLYQDYQSGCNAEMIVDAAVTIAAMILFGRMLDEALSTTSSVKAPKRKIQKSQEYYFRRKRHGMRNSL